MRARSINIITVSWVCCWLFSSLAEVFFSLNINKQNSSEYKFDQENNNIALNMSFNGLSIYRFKCILWRVNQSVRIMSILTLLCLQQSSGFWGTRAVRWGAQGSRFIFRYRKTNHQKSAPQAKNQKIRYMSPHGKLAGFRNQRNFCLWNLEPWALESRIQLKQSGIPLMIRILNASSIDMESRIKYLESGLNSV